MTVDWSDIDAYRKAQAAQQHDRLTDHRRTAQHVFIRMDDLLADDAWGVYRRHLEAQAKTLEATLEPIRGMILGAAVGDELLKAKLEARYLEGLLEGYRQALALPEELRRQAQEVVTSA